MKLYQGDCLEIMDKIPCGSVDCIITSPPYNINVRTNNGNFVSRYGKNGNAGHFANKYENYKDDFMPEDYYKFQKKFLEKALKISDLVFYNIQIVAGNKQSLFRLLGDFSDKIKEVIIWNKLNSQPAMEDGVLNSQYEFVFVLQNSKPYARKFYKCGFERGTETNVWDIKRERNKYHKAAFPITLVERLLKDFTNPNDIILDPFMGSGTTGVACKHLNRDFIGIELDENYFNIAKNRIESELL